MTIRLKQSTASQEVPLGHFVDSTDGNTEETALTIANTDIKLWKNGATSLASKNSGGATHMANGIYYAVLDDTDTNTLGPLVIFVHVSGALPVRLECEVLAANVFDSLIAASDKLDVDTYQITNNAITANAINSGAITNAKFASGAIDATAVADGAIDAGAIATGAITNTKFAANAIDANAIATGAITSAKLASGAITSTVMASGAITSSVLAASAIAAGNIATGAITNAKFAAGAIDAGAIADSAIDAASIAADLKTGSYLNAQVKGQDNIDFGALQKTSLNAATPALSAAGNTAVKTAMEAAGSHLALIKAKTDLIGAFVALETGGNLAAVRTQTDKLAFTGTLVQADVQDWKGAAAPAMTGDAYARLGAPAGVSVSADIADIHTDLANLSGANIDITDYNLTVEDA